MAFNDLDDNYSFLNDYLSRVTSDAGRADQATPMDDDNVFYDNGDQPIDDSTEPGITYDTDDGTEDVMTQAESMQNDEDGDVMDYLLGGQDPYSVGATDQDEDSDQFADENMNTPGTGEGPGRLANKISGNESEGKYTAMNHHGGGAGAVGKYQFRWNIWKESIQKITGVKSKEEFLHSPKAQEKYFAWYEKSYLKPAAMQLQRYNKAGLDLDQLEQLVHFRGEGGAKKYLQGKLVDKPESYNVPISQYISKKQTGGYAETPEQQYMGLNDESFNEMLFPMNGVNEFRGLDNGEPVYLEDETGKKKILRGNNDKTKMIGKVYERKMQAGGSSEGPITFLNSYFASPEFKRRYKLDDSLLNLNNSLNYPIAMNHFERNRDNYHPYVAPLNNDGSYYGSMSTPRSSFTNDEIKELNIPEGTNIYLDPNEEASLAQHYRAKEPITPTEKFNMLFNQTLPHEYSHRIRNLGDTEKERIKSLANNGANEHDDDPSEQYSDLNTLRWLMNKEGIYDTRKGDLNLQTLQKALENENIKDTPIINRLLRHFTPENLVKFNNTIASNNNDDNSEKAQTGAKISKKYILKKTQTGGNTNEGPITFTNSYFESPEFKRRFGDSTRYDDQMNNFRINRDRYRPYVAPPSSNYTSSSRAIQNADFSDSELKELNAPKGTNVYINPNFVPVGQLLYANSMDERKKVSYLYDNNLNDALNVDLPHEYAHRVRSLTDSEQNKIKALAKKNTKNNNSISPMLNDSAAIAHDTSPDEQYADLNALRWLMNKYGIYDARKGDIDKKTLEKAFSDDRIKNHYIINRLKQHFSLDNLVKFNNTIANNKNNDQWQTNQA